MLAILFLGQPEQVDWIGQKHQIDAAKKAGISHVVMIATMGATTIPGAHGIIYTYKKKSSEYLIESGLVYTIINPCGLADGEEGERELVFSKRNELWSKDYTKTYQLRRSDLAEVTLQALLISDAKNKAFDLLSREGKPKIDFVAAFKTTTPEL